MSGRGGALLLCVLGIEPRTHGLEGRCSTDELCALVSTAKERARHPSWPRESNPPALRTKQQSPQARPAGSSRKRNRTPAHLINSEVPSHRALLERREAEALARQCHRPRSPTPNSVRHGSSGFQRTRSSFAASVGLVESDHRRRLQRPPVDHRSPNTSSGRGIRTLHRGIQRPAPRPTGNPSASGGLAPPLHEVRARCAPLTLRTQCRRGTPGNRTRALPGKNRLLLLGANVPPSPALDRCVS